MLNQMVGNVGMSEEGGVVERRVQFVIADIQQFALQS